MHDLRVTGVENGALLATSDDGNRFRISIDEATLLKLRQNAPHSTAVRKLAPRDVQAQIRSGMSAEDIAAVTGASLEYIQRFEGPILAEREYVVNAALAVPVHTAMEVDPLGEGSTFGSVIRERLHDLDALDERWTSWKEPDGGWIVKLAFSADEIDHDARWQFDPKKSALAPLNSEAITLSQQGEVAGALIPRLRAVGVDERQPDNSRFDSGAFTEEELSHRDTVPYLEAIPFNRRDTSGTAPSREDDSASGELGHTADLLEALRRRRGEREAASFDAQDEARAAHPSTGSIRIIDVPLDHFDDVSGADSGEPDFVRPDTNTMVNETTTPRHPASPSSQQKPSHQPVGRAGKKARVSMPSWDDIVFGAKSDDDL